MFIFLGAIRQNRERTALYFVDIRVAREACRSLFGIRGDGKQI